MESMRSPDILPPVRGAAAATGRQLAAGPSVLDRMRAAVPGHGPAGTAIPAVPLIVDIPDMVNEAPREVDGDHCQKDHQNREANHLFIASFQTAISIYVRLREQARGHGPARHRTFGAVPGKNDIKQVTLGPHARRKGGLPGE